jgi:hypothetical protein
MSTAEDLATFASVGVLTHDSSFGYNHVVEANTNALLIGPITLPGIINVQENAALTVFGEVSVTGSLTVDGNLDIR